MLSTFFSSKYKNEWQLIIVKLKCNWIVCLFVLKHSDKKINCTTYGFYYAIESRWISQYISHYSQNYNFYATKFIFIIKKSILNTKNEDMETKLGYVFLWFFKHWLFRYWLPCELQARIVQCWCNCCFVVVETPNQLRNLSVRIKTNNNFIIIWYFE